MATNQSYHLASAAQPGAAFEQVQRNAAEQDCDERRGEHLRELVRHIPAERLLIETDSPYLLPRDLRPKPAAHCNEPAHLAHIAAVIAACRGERPSALAAQTTANARGFFRLPG